MIWFLYSSRHTILLFDSHAQNEKQTQQQWMKGTKKNCSTIFYTCSPNETSASKFSCRRRLLYIFHPNLTRCRILKRQPFIRRDHQISRSLCAAWYGTQIDERRKITTAKNKKTKNKFTEYKLIKSKAPHLSLMHPFKQIFHMCFVPVRRAAERDRLKCFGK